MAELDLTIFKRIGIVAGASTPFALFEEVKKYMGTLSEKDVCFDFMKKLEQSFKKSHGKKKHNAKISYFNNLILGDSTSTITETEILTNRKTKTY